MVEATERLYHGLFAAAVLYAIVSWAWGMALAPFNAFNDSTGRSVALCGIGMALALVAFWYRHRLFYRLRATPALLIGIALLGIALQWLDGGWNSTAYVGTYTAVGFAAVTQDLRWSLTIGLLTATGYALGVVAGGYDWERLQGVNDAEQQVANTTGYVLAAVFLALPVRWLGGYVARINQVISRRPTTAPLPRERTKALSVREVQITQLVADGKTNDQIAAELFLSPRTVQVHVRNAMMKTESANRTELGVLAVREGLVG